MNDDEKDMLEETMEVVANQGGSKKKVRMYLIAMGLIVVLAISLFLTVNGNILQGKNKRILLAAANTFNYDSKLLKNLNKTNFYKSKEHSFDLDITTNGESFHIEYNANEARKQLTGSFAFDGISNMDLIAELDSNFLKAKLSPIDRIFSYNYKNVSKGYVAELLGDEFTNSLDESLESIYLAQDDEQEITKKLTKVLYEEFNSLKFIDGDKKEFDINGKKRDIKGYKTIITPAILEETLNSLDEVVKSNYEGAEGLMDLPSLARYKDNYDDLLNYIRNDMQDIELIIYIYGNKLVSIEVDWADDNLQILFHKDKEQNQSIQWIVDNEIVLEIKSSLNDSIESLKIEIDGENYGEFLYDRNSGDFSIELVEEYTKIEGNIQATKDEISITVDKAEYYGMDMEVSIDFTMNKEASFESMSGQEFSVDTASQDEFFMLLEEISEDINELLYLFGSNLY